jgi:hypothetical protein
MSQNQCLGRLVDDKQFGLFGDKKHKFYLELRCSKTCVPGTKLCGKCHDRPHEQVRTQSAMLHGLVTEDPPPWSHIFEGDWYKAKVPQYGEPSEEEMAKGKKAKLEATGRPIVSIASAPANLATLETPTSTGKPDSVEKEKEKPKKPRVRKSTSANTIIQPTSTLESPLVLVPTQALESNELVLDDVLVKKICVKRFTYKGVEYFLEGTKQKVYASGADRRPTTFVGYWNPLNQTIDTGRNESDVDA